MNDGLDQAAHIVQLALTPIFLLAGIAQLLNVFSARLGRISDRVDLLSGEHGQAHELKRLRLRSELLDAAVLLAAIAGALTCGAALDLFAAVLRGRQESFWLFALFGGALGFAILALIVFGAETVLAGRTLRAKTLTRRDG